MTADPSGSDPAAAALPGTAADGIAALAADLRRAVLRLNRELRRRTQLPGVSPIHGTLLALIQRNPGVGVSELAALERMRVPTMSGHVRRLEEAGLVTRSPAPERDRRRVGLSVTPAGEQVVDAIRRQRTDWLAERLRSLAPEARAALRDAVSPLRQLSE